MDLPAPIPVRRSFLPTFLLVLACVGLAAPTWSQETFGDVIDVRVVNLEVVVTDKAGNRITGLQPEDFRLMVDKREVPIEYFTEVSGGTAVMRGDEGSVGTLPALAPGQPVGTSYLVFIDEFFSLAVDRNRVLEGLREHLPGLRPEDRMAIVAFDGRQIEMLSTWSSSVSALDRAVRDAIARPSYGLHRQAERRNFDDQPRIARLSRRSPLDTQVGLDEEHFVGLLEGQVSRSVQAASAALRSFANPPGRKVMLLLSGGWPYNPSEWAIQESPRAIYTRGSDGPTLLSPLVETANRLSYTLYPVDVPGQTGTVTDVADATVGDAFFTQRRQRDRERNEQTSLGFLAEETGGRALLNSNRLDAFQQTIEDTRSYYWIGFTPDWVGDDESHNVRLVPKNRRFRVRSRGGYSDLSRSTEVTMMVESSLLFGDSPAFGRLVAELGPSKKAGLGKVKVALRVAIPLDAITFLPVSSGYRAETELRVAVLDSDGNTADVPVIPLGLDLEGPPGEQTFSVYETELRLRKRAHDIVVSLHDVASGAILSSRLDFEPGT